MWHLLFGEWNYSHVHCIKSELTLKKKVVHPPILGVQITGFKIDGIMLSHDIQH